ncbi:MAG: hypothetical protein B1H04_02595 [Planctomycetales bacterium 4484_123]|nr:MAG: hypothetical protein B1H04_02595 [Planctomycetales bacterium 4484_123]
MAEGLNVLLITADQMRADHMGCGGNPIIRTPNLDRLAAGGVCLERAYVSNPVCMPNRSTIATGRLPRNHGCWSNGINLPADERTIADILGGQGYHTALLGKAHFQTFGHGGDPAKAGMECGAAWEQGLHDPDWTGPYYGFQHVELCIGHGVANLRRAHLGKWVAENYPEALGSIDRRRPSPTGAPQCYTPLIPAEAHSSSWLGQVGSEYLRRLARAGRPFFLWVSFPDPHHPFVPPRPYDTMYAPAEVIMPVFGPEALADKPETYRRAYGGGELWEGIDRSDRLCEITEPQLREIIARTYGMVSLIDRNVGKLLDALEQTRLAESTIVIFTSDHGDLMGDCGLLYKGPFLLEGLIRVPMLWRVPGAARGVRSDGLFSSCDIAPTILSLLGLEVPAAMDGLAQPDLVGGGNGLRDAAFVEFKSMYRPELNLRAIVTADEKLTFYAGLETGELYDLNGAGEARNLYHDPAWAQRRAELEHALLVEAVLSHDKRHLPTCHA